MKNIYQVELVWNRSFLFIPYGECYKTIEGLKHFEKMKKEIELGNL